MPYFCNPVNYGYKYQFNQQPDGGVIASREGADPSMVLFRGRYYIFPSMTCGFLYSDDLARWQFHPLKNMPVYDYAPDVRVVGEYLYFCASNHEKGTHYRTKDPFTNEYERIEGAFAFWDPNLFADENGRLYFYWGSSPTEPLYGVELDPESLKPLGERVPLVWGDETQKGFERTGEDHIPERTAEEKAAILAGMAQQGLPESIQAAAKAFILGSPYVEGAWMNKHGGRYYLQYGASGSRFNVYGDGVYVSEQPLGPFRLAANNPFSYKPGGFLPGAGHGSSMQDRSGNLWHVATSRICVNHNFERRISLWPAGWDAEGELFCNQRYGDWPCRVEERRLDPWADPEWMLLSYGKAARASSCVKGKEAGLVANEDVRTWWQAAANKPGEWVEIDLGQVFDVRAVQVNFADDALCPPLPEGACMNTTLEQQRWIDEIPQPTRWKLAGSRDGAEYFIIEDKSEVETDLPHDLVVRPQGVAARYLRLTVYGLPYGQAACVSGLRAFGLGHGAAPGAARQVSARRQGGLDVAVCWQGDGLGYVVQWGFAPEKLYHSRQVFGCVACIGGLVRGQPVYVRVDSFNESGITCGQTLRVEE